MKMKQAKDNQKIDPDRYKSKFKKIKIKKSQKFQQKNVNEAVKRQSKDRSCQA